MPREGHEAFARAFYAAFPDMRHAIEDVFFFFQADAGIRVFHVTGVQTCARPITSPSSARCPPAHRWTTSTRTCAPPRRAGSARSSHAGGCEKSGQKRQLWAGEQLLARYL